MRKFLTILKCPVHENFWAVEIGGTDGLGARLTPAKCCGQWKEVRKWEMGVEEWRGVLGAVEGAIGDLLRAEEVAEKKDLEGGEMGENRGWEG